MAKVIPMRNQSPQTSADFVPNVDRSTTTPESFQSGLTAQIARRSVRVLLEEQGFKIQRTLSSIDHHEGNVDRKFVEKVAELIRRVIKTSPSELPSVRQLAEERWVIHAGNVYSEYMQLSQQLFHDGINWGRLVAYVGFTATYCLYAMQLGVPESVVESVAAWMVQVLGRDHVEWFNQHSWVSRTVV